MSSDKARELLERVKARLKSASINDRRHERPMTWEEADVLVAALSQPAPVREAMEALELAANRLDLLVLYVDDLKRRRDAETWREEVRKALTSLRERPTDEWVLVPKEPTDEMLSAGWLVAPGEDRVARARYAAMLAAAAPPSSSTGEVG